MRLGWTFLIGLFFAGFVMLVTAPLLVAGLGLTAWVAKAEMFNALEGVSVFGLREKDGRLDGRMVNVNFQIAHVLMPGDPRPRRLLLRLDVTNADVFASRPGEGRIRLDAWPMDAAMDLKQKALFTVIAPGRSATVAEDGTLVVEHGSRRSVYTLAGGIWLYDADLAPATFTTEGERRRVVALSAVEEDMPSRTVAVLTYATSQAILKRVMITAEDPIRARLLRSSAALIRPVARMDDASRRIIDLSLPAGLVRIPMNGDDLDIANAQVPLGLGLTELKPWRAAR